MFQGRVTSRLGRIPRARGASQLKQAQVKVVGMKKKGQDAGTFPQMQIFVNGVVCLSEINQLAPER